MTESIILSDEELKQLTGYVISSKQIRWLESNHISHYVNGAKRPVVLRATLSQLQPASHIIVNNQQPNFEAING